jgi:hypothetical protein
VLQREAECGLVGNLFAKEELELLETDSYSGYSGKAVIMMPDSLSNTKALEEYINIKFQEGTIQENGVNGAQIEDVIDLLVDRLSNFQKGDFACRENSLAITKLEEARMWLNERTRKRME